ncbi:hypothetical protein K493DRAFT_341501 [Basidiobolus meristosporus CBS 931.73]|uniref:PIN domain-containing protein n=1 Tax=Basidiobolus meristosporus CBS 931.73 TaxID=1314790 RepID=A0A1Y1XNL1_9FUNG|nr:hypothetical protein K493DRAFT_341501 [Basidiobolus meristosporus CBS 931.73]|eukprot:ORX87350.1 hypothetical protein K493DRAFT_341501 [Basidiobolus meristosporus CBS 931.73]
MSSKEKSNLVAKQLLSDILRYEDDLKTSELQTRQAKTRETAVAAAVEAAHIRSNLKDLYEELILSDLKLAKENDIEERLWHTIFHGPIKMLRGQLSKMQSKDSTAIQRSRVELSRLFELGTGFYHTLLNSVKLQSDINLDTFGFDLLKLKETKFPKYKEIGAACIQRCLTYLGDLSRYQEDSTEKEIKDWSLARDFYAQAVRVYPDSGRPHGQLALLATYSGNHIEAIYWNCLSLVTKYPSSIARSNLQTLYATVTKATDNTSFDGFERFTTLFVKLQARLLFSNSSEEPIQDLETQVTDYLEKLLLNGLGEDAYKQSVRIITICIATLWDLFGRLKDSSGTSQNLQAAKLAQFQTLSLILRLQITYFQSPVFTKIRWSEMDSPEWKLNEFQSAILSTLTIWTSFCLSNFEYITQLYQSSKSDPDLKHVQTNVEVFIHMYIDLLNLLPTSCDRKIESTEYLSEDVMLLGIQPLRKLHKELTIGPLLQMRHQSPVQKTQAQLNRIRKLAFKLHESDVFDLVQYNDAEMKYIIVNEGVKLQNKERLMKAMAQQLLIDQVNSLEQDLARMPAPKSAAQKNTVLRQIILDVGVFLDHLPKIKRWISTRKCVIIVPLEVIESLDDLKKGTGSLNARAREVIRFLEGKFKVADQFIRPQRPSEQLSDWSEAQSYFLEEDEEEFEGDEEDEEFYGPRTIDHVPLEYRPLLGCYFYHKNIAAKISTLIPTLLIVEDVELLSYAQWFDIQSMDVNQFVEWLGQQ